MTPGHRHAHGHAYDHALTATGRHRDTLSVVLGITDYEPSVHE